MARISSGAGFALDTLGHDFSTPVTAMHWADIMERMNAAEMPPKGSLQPSPKEVANIADWITAQLKEADADQKAGLGEKVAFRRLTREEYRNTIRDLLGSYGRCHRPCRTAGRPGLAGLPAYRLGAHDFAGARRKISGGSGIRPERSPAARPSALSATPCAGLPLICADPRYRTSSIARGNAGKVRADIVPNNGANGTPGENKLLDHQNRRRVQCPVEIERPASSRRHPAPRERVCGRPGTNAVRAGCGGAGRQADHRRVPYAPARRSASDSHSQCRSRPEPGGQLFPPGRRASLYRPAPPPALADQTDR